MGNIGDHIRKRRIERGLCQKGTATLVGVSVDTLRAWETQGVSPRTKNIPGIIEFLGYDPALPRQNVAELIARERKRRKLSIAAMAAQVGVSADTLRNWEESRYLPLKSGYEKLAAFLFGNEFPVSPGDRPS